MPFPAGSARNRRAKERNASVASSSRRQRDVSKAHESRGSLYARGQNTALEQVLPDQLPPLPSSGTASPSSTASPVLQSSQITLGSSQLSETSGRGSMDSGGVYHLAVVPHTPAALQPYLEDDTNSRSGDDTISAEGPDQASSTVDTSADAIYAEVEAEICESASADSPLQAPKPQSAVVHEALEVPFDNKSLSPLAGTSLVTSQPSRSPRPPSTAYPAHGGPYMTSPQAFAPVVPYQGAFAGEQYYMPPYPGQHHHQMAPREADMRQYAAQPLPYYTEHGPSYPYQIAFNSVANPPLPTYVGNPRLSGLVSVNRGIPRGTAEMGGQMNHERALTGGSATGDNGQDLVDRVQTVIPDLHLLVSRFRETADQLDAREAKIRQTEAAKVEALRQKEAYISRLEREIDSMSHKYAAENEDLKREIEEREEERQDLEANAASRHKSKERLEAAYHNLQKEKELIEKRSEQASRLAAQESAEWKEKLMEEFTAKKKQMNEELQQKIKHEVAMQNRMSEMHRSQSKERESLRVALEAAQWKERESREAWDNERETLMQEWEEERKKFKRDLEDQRRAVDARYAEDKEKLQKGSRRTSHVQLNMHPEVENAELRKEVERFRTLWISDKSKLAKATDDVRDVTAKLQSIADACAEPSEFRG
ncbi:MAG: hypothetical protein MMC33_001608 [Icmadophila ericetorum]|nr:hypothetical protein [Icmadophila ericetorum]